MKELLVVDQACTSDAANRHLNGRHTAITDTPSNLYRQDGSKKIAVRVQDTTSFPTFAPALCIMSPDAPKGIGNCTILLSIQIGVMDDLEAQQGACQARSASSCVVALTLQEPKLWAMV
ncbi:MAG: hypothetical protein CFE38_21130 [Comamonadaceae bacterium PBBC1]|nr:MAG: hypothetical protein CFE38_21130 [Comamonadaceae bacterium PBBC1]